MMRKSAILLIAAIVLGAPMHRAQHATDNETIVARIIAKTDAERFEIVRLGLDLMEYREGDDLIFWTTAKRLKELRDAGHNVRIDERLTEEMRESLQRDTFNGGYRTVEETRAFLETLASRYPNLAQTFTYGNSWIRTQNASQGYELFGIKLTNRSIPGYKPTILVEGGIHARELVPVEIASRFVEYLLINYGRDADATWLLDEHLIVIVPIVNPDGRKLAETGLSKRKNMNNTIGSCTQVSTGIDLNRNFQFLWGTVNGPTEPPCGGTFPGLSAASEPETSAMQNLVLSLFPDQRPPDRTIPAPLDATGVFFDMHSTGNLILYPWGQDTTPPPNLQLRTIAQKLASYNGYNPIQSIQLYPTSGTAREFAYGELGVAGLVLEIGMGSGSCGGFMPAFSCLDGGTNGNFWNLNRPALIYLAKIARTPYMTSEGATAESVSLTRTGVGAFSIRAQLSDAANGNQNISAAEFYVDTPPWRGGIPIAMTPEDGSFNTPVEFAVGNVNVSAGRHIIYVRGRDSANNWGAVRAAFTPSRSVNADFDGDARTDVSVFRPENAVWYVNTSSNNGFQASHFGISTDKLVPADYDGDGKTDLAVFRGGAWYILRSQSGTFVGITFGLAGDLPSPADFDGDGRADVSVFRSGNWFILNSLDGTFSAVPFGQSGDRPVAGDYDADGRADQAVFRNGTWYLFRSTQGFAAIGFGLSSDQPVQADYDGDGRTDVAVYRSGVWYLLQSQNGFAGFQFGAAGDIPTPGDYDGDGRADAAVYRSGAWYLLQSTAGFGTRSWGFASDMPIPSAYLP